MNARFERMQTAQALLDSDNGEIYSEVALKTLSLHLLVDLSRNRMNFLSIGTVVS